MGVGIRHVDRDKQIEMRNGNVIFLNDLDPINDEYLIKQLTVTTYENSSFSLIPTCNCGATTKLSHPDKHIGDICEYCFTPLAIPGSRKVESSIWIRTPDDVERFIDISFLAMLLDIYKINKKDGTVIHWLLDPYWNGWYPDNQVDFLRHHGVKRGLNYFVNNADFIMALLNDPDVFAYNSGPRQQLYIAYQRDKDLLFPRYLPLPDKSFNVVERGHLGSYTDFDSFNPYMNVINIVTGLKRLKKNPPLSKKEHIAAKILFGLVNYYSAYIQEFHNKKTGEYRKQVYGSRLPFTSRQVITSITEPHDYEEIHMPWSAMIPVMEYQLTNLMLRDGYRPNDIKKKLMQAVNQYDPEIDAYFDRLLEESPHRTRLSNKPGIMVIHNRNPSLKMGSLQTCLVTRIKKDPKDITKSVSVLTMPVMNSEKSIL